MVWMPPDPKGRLILVNIPEFRLHVLEDGEKVFNMNIVVGKEGHSTVLFSGNLDRIVLNPYWNLPRSIVKKEVLPEMEKNEQYLSEHDMEITGQDGEIPVIRQKPGPLNELGKIKFLFPNSFNIYLHDTPHKELFKKAQRAFSHGCIRVADARRLADYLLKGMPEWTAEKMDSVFAVGKERAIMLKEPVPVLIYYLTAGSDEGNAVEFRKDLYGHDARVEKKLFMK
jgi:murein L,D-transpeptidase YcbB/YkuD